MDGTIIRRICAAGLAAALVAAASASASAQTADGADALRPAAPVEQSPGSDGVSAAAEPQEEDEMEFSWTVSVPGGEISLRPGQSIPVGVAVGPVPATGVALGFETLVEAETKRIADRGWQLCAERASEDCDAPLSLAESSVQQLFLRPAGQSPLIGSYAGAVTIASAEDIAGSTATLTVHGTSDRHRAIGGVLIFASVLLAFIVANVFQHAISRAELLQPAERLRARIDRMRARLDQALARTGGDMPDTKALLTTLKAQLSARALRNRGLLPPRLPAPYSLEFDHAPLEEFLSAAGAWAGVASLLIAEGADEIADLKASGAPDGNVSDGLDALDAIARGALDASGELRPALDQDAAAQQVANIVADVGKISGIQPGAPAAPRRRTALEAIQSEVRMLSVATWSVYLLLTTALGIYVVIYTDPGFGTLGDLIRCVFWGFGLPIGATLLQQTPANVRAVLSIPVPKQA